VRRSSASVACSREPCIRDGVHIGDILDVAAPRGSFILEPGSGPVILLSAGVGATPVLAMLHALAATMSPREVWWIHGAYGSRRASGCRGGACLSRSVAQQPPPHPLQLAGCRGPASCRFRRSRGTSSGGHQVLLAAMRPAGGDPTHALFAHQSHFRATPPPHARSCRASSIAKAGISIIALRYRTSRHANKNDR
jgi:hypothetical protein